MISNPNLAHAKTAAARRSRLALVMAVIAPFAAASMADAQPFAYVVGQPNGRVSVINTSTNVSVASVLAGQNCSLCFNPDGIAIAANAGRVYVTNEFAQSVSVIDVASNTVVTTLPIPGGPTSIVASPNGTRVYVLNGSGASGASVTEIDTTTNAVVKSMPLLVLQAQGMGMAPDGTRLYVSTAGSNSIKVITTATMTVTATIPVGIQPFGVDVSPDGLHVYVASSLSHAVSVIDTATNAVGTIPVGLRPISARATPDGSRVYVANHDSSNLSVIDRQTHTVVNTVQLPPGSAPRTLDFTPDGTRAYVATSWGVQVIDLATNTLITPIPFAPESGFPASIAIGRALNGNPPTAVSESYVTTPNAPLNVAAPGVLANDNTDGGGPMTAELVTNVTHGSLTFNADGSFGYAPTAGLVTDSFTYRAVNAAGKSNIATVTLRLLTGPQPPTGFYVSSVVGNIVTLRWTPPSVGDSPTGYRLEGGVSPGHVADGISIGGTTPILTFNAPTGSFYIRMHTLSGGARSAASEEIRLIVGVPALPSAPTNLLGLVDGSTVSLAWRNTFEGGTPDNVVLQVTGSLDAIVPRPMADSATVVNVPPGTYTISMAARNATGPSGVSNAITLTVPAACSGVPAPPTNFVASRTGNLITVLWERATSGPAATAFVVNVSGSHVESFSTTERTLSGTVGRGSYTLTVQARNRCGDSAPTAAQTVVIP